MTHPPRRMIATAAATGLALATLGGRAMAQTPRNVVTGRVVVVTTRAPVVGATVTIEGTILTAIADTGGRFRFVNVPPGPQVLLARRIGLAPARVSITVPEQGTVTHDISMAESALEIPEIKVTADVSSRAKGELGTASVIDHEAVKSQSAASLQGVLELLPGTPLQPPGLSGVQQFSLRSVPTSTVGGLTAGGPTAGQLSSLGTSFVLDGVPLSNNANLQTTGPRGEQQVILPTTSGGGIDLRQIPASTIERVEAIRGVPSARYGDLTEGVVVVDTRAGAISPSVNARVDAKTTELSLVGGRHLGSGAISATGDVASTLVRPGLSLEDATRLTLGLAHRGRFGTDPGGNPDLGHVTLDTRLDFFQMLDDNPEQPLVLPGKTSTNHDNGLRAQERARFALGASGSFTWTSALSYTRRRSTAQSYYIRGASPFTDRLTEGTQTGLFVQGRYLSQYELQGDEWNIYDRFEVETPFSALGFYQHLRAGAELNRQWNAGPGYIFNIETPPQVAFDGINGYDRPYRFDSVPPMATSALYLDDRLVRDVFGAGLEVQAGVRLDLLHSGTWWTSGVRDAAIEPRLNAQLSPAPWLRLRAGWGLTAKSPTLGQLGPPPQYYDVVNVNYFANNPAERLAVLTTFIRSPYNPDLGFSTGHKREVGLEMSTPGGDAALSIVLFQDKTTGGIGFNNTTQFLPRDHYALTDTVQGSGHPPTVVQPPVSTDTVPIVIQQPANILTLDNRGLEGTLTLPEIRPIGTRLEVQGAWTKSDFFQDGPDFGRGFVDFQRNTAPRAPYWSSVTNTGERVIVTYRLIHHEPRLGLIVTAVVQQTAYETRQNVAANDTLAFAGYVTRTGQLVPIPADQRADPQYNDLHLSRSGLQTQLTDVPADWMASIQVSKTVPLGGELRFYAFNVFDRLGGFQAASVSPRVYPPMQFGLELTMQLNRLLPVLGQGGDQ